MSYGFAVSPDVHARDLSNWFILNTRLQKALAVSMHPKIYDDFADLHRAIDEGRIDLVYANAADTALLVRKKGFTPVARAAGVSDEAIVVVAQESPVRSIEDLEAPLSAAATDAPDVERICRILLEPADLSAECPRIVVKRNYVLVAKAVIAGEVQAGFMLREAFEELAELTRKMLRPIIASKIYVVNHCLLAGPNLAGKRQGILFELAAISGDPAAQELLAGLGAPRGWSAMDEEEAEFMVDLMDTLSG